MEDLSQHAEAQLERHFIRRLGHLLHVRRFVATWMLLLILLIGCVTVQIRSLGGYYQTLQPAPGGMYVEGIVGRYTNANPLYASGQVDEAVAHLIFSGLLKYDDQNKLVGDLAKSWSVDKTGTTYTVHLRPNLTWQDGKPLTAKDVVFTYQVIQNPDAQSPLNDSWQDVEVNAPDDNTVVFTLPNPLSSFPESLTTGIIPQHLLGTVPMDQMRSVAFNTTNPVGAGPFSMKTVEVHGDTPETREEQVALEPFDGYHGGRPKLNSFVVHTFGDESRMQHSFDDHNLNAMVGLDTAPSKLAHSDAAQIYQMPLTAATMVFFKSSSPVLSDATVRQALVTASEPHDIIGKLGYLARPVQEPLLEGQLGYNAAYQQHTGNLKKAGQLLDKAGWRVGQDGIRTKHGQPLSFSLYAEDTPEYRMVTNELRTQWRALGVDARVYMQRQTELQTTVSTHAYDALLYGISIGADPDVFVYWDSSQADVRSGARLNLSEYQSTAADSALEAGRTRTVARLRTIKYQPFLQAWQQDAPALGLYQPRFLYITRSQVFGLREHTLNTDTDRYTNVANWEIRQAPQTIKR